MASQKGSGFERDMARAISLWWTRNATEEAFWRVLGSGSRATVRTKSGKDVSFSSFSDIEPKTADAHAFTDQVICELKRGYSGWAITDVLDSKNPKKKQWAAFFEQIAFAWKSSGKKYWICIFKRDQRKIMVALSPELWMDLPKDFLAVPRAILRNTGYDCVLITWEDFTKIDPDFFRRSAKEDVCKKN